MECTPDTAWDIFREKVEALQEDAALVFPMGKKIKVTSMHLTIGTLLLKEEEVQKVHDQLQELTQKFLDVVGATYGLMLTFQGIGWGDHRKIWAEAKMGAAPIMAYRELLEDTFDPFLTDSRFHMHLLVFKNVKATPQEKARFKASNIYVTLSPINLEMVTLRERKVPGEVLKQLFMVVPHSRSVKRKKESKLMSHVSSKVKAKMPDVLMIS